MIFFFELFENNEERYEKPDLKSDKTVVYMFKHKTNESLKVGYNATVLKKIDGIKMTNAQKWNFWYIYACVSYIYDT